MRELHAGDRAGATRRRCGDVVRVGVGCRRRGSRRGSWRRARRRASHSSSTSTAAPSLMTKPSRSASNGRDVPTLDSAVMLREPGQRGDRHRRLAAAGEHGVAAPVGDEPRRVADRVRPGRARGDTSSRTGPASRSASTVPRPRALAIIIGTRNGDTRRSPFSTPHDHLRLERLESADAGAEEHAGAIGVDADVTRLRERLGRGGEGDLRERRCASISFGLSKTASTSKLGDPALTGRLRREQPRPERRRARCHRRRGRRRR